MDRDRSLSGFRSKPHTNVATYITTLLPLLLLAGVAEEFLNGALCTRLHNRIERFCQESSQLVSDNGSM